jgi:undecaprenyl-diphosphatase
MYFIIILALVQGLTEFLPVSSSGHLILMPKLFNVKDQGVIVDIALHSGTLLAVLVYFREVIFSMISDCFVFIKNGEKSNNTRLAFYLIISTIPAVIIGLFLKKIGLDRFRSILIVASSLMFYGVIMLFCGRFSIGKKLEELNLKDSVIIGLCQALAFVPGTSRSGTCMIAANFLGFSKRESAKFSFLLSIPTIAGATLLASLDLYKYSSSFDINIIGIGVLLSFIFGIMAIHLMMKFLQKYSLKSFGIYRISLSIVLFAIYFFNK